MSYTSRFMEKTRRGSLNTIRTSLEESRAAAAIANNVADQLSNNSIPTTLIEPLMLDASVKILSVLEKCSRDRQEEKLAVFLNELIANVRATE